MLNDFNFFPLLFIFLLLQLDAMMNFLEAGRYKITCAMAATNGESKPDYKFSQYIERTKDKQVSNDFLI
jgi:hypothetical protein